MASGSSRVRFAKVARASLDNCAAVPMNAQYRSANLRIERAICDLPIQQRRIARLFQDSGQPPGSPKRLCRLCRVVRNLTRPGEPPQVSSDASIVPSRRIERSAGFSRAETAQNSTVSHVTSYSERLNTYKMSHIWRPSFRDAES